MKTKLELLGPRKLLAVGLRRSGLTFRKIGERIGVGPNRASQIVARGERMLERWEQGDDAVELDCRASNCISNAGVGFSREAVKEAIEGGVLNVHKVRMYGRKTHKICCEYAGIPHHYEYESIKRLRAEIRRLEKPIKELEEAIKELENSP
jgi:hypothetical protein